MTRLNDLINRHAQSTPERLAFSGFGGDFTYDELQRFSNQIANQLMAEGFSKGTRYALYTPNCGGAVIASLGALAMGGVWCNVNLKNTVEENIDVLTRGNCEVLLFHSVVEEDALRIFDETPSLKLMLCIDKATERAAQVFEWARNASEVAPDVEIDEVNDIGFQGNTGGTTGLPKLTQSGHVFLAKGAYLLSKLLHVDGHMRNLCVAPITHAGGMVCFGALAAGGTNIMMVAADLEGILDNLERERITTMFLPPTVVYMLLVQPGVRERDFSALRNLMTAAAPISPDKIEEAIQVFGNVMCQALGQTESGFPLTFISPEEVTEAINDPAKRHRLASCGRSCGKIDRLAIMDDAGNLLPAGGKGEIVMQGDTIMHCYLGDPEASAEMKQFGWHHTGDIGHLDEDGYLYISDRKRDLIISGGFNIFPYEVESCLLKHPSVQDCAVVGLPDEKWGEMVTGVLELAPGASFDEGEIIQYCKDRIGSMKAPKKVLVMDALPRSPVGKVLKREIRRQYS